MAARRGGEGRGGRLMSGRWDSARSRMTHAGGRLKGRGGGRRRGNDRGDSSSKNGIKGRLGEEGG